MQTTFIESGITRWRQQLTFQQALDPAEVEELEVRLRAQIGTLTEAGLNEEEALLIAIRRMGESPSPSRESEPDLTSRSWKTTTGSISAELSALRQKESWMAVGLAAAAALTMKIPNLFGVPFDESPPAAEFYTRNISLLTLPFMAVYFAWKRRLSAKALLPFAALFMLMGLWMNLAPFKSGGSTLILAIIHLPLLMWFVAGCAYLSGRWDQHSQRMNLVRFSGEWFIYLTLIACGGGVLMLSAIFLFQSIGLEVEELAQDWLLPCGFAGATVISGWLAETRQSVMGNLAPMLTRLFTPLFTILLFTFLGAMLWSEQGIRIDREMLIGFDLLLALILGLLLYSISARDPEASPGWFDWLQLLLVAAALLVDLIALEAIALRISDFGFSANKIAALGENLILLLNLAGAAVLYARFLIGKRSFSVVERWQTTYLPVYPIWAGIVVVVFPIIFRFQ